MLLALAALTLAATLGDAAAAASGAANAQAPRLGGIGLPAGMAPPDLSASSAPPAPTSQLERQIAEADLDLHDLSKSFGSSTLTDVEIASRLAAVAPIQSNLAAVIAALTPKLARIDARLAQLGPAPGPGQIPEASQIADNRRALSHARQNLDADIKQARLLAVEAGQLASMLQSRRAEQLTAQLWTHSRSILDPGLWRECAEALPADGQRLQTVLSDQLDAASKASGSSLVVAGWALALLASLIIAVPVRLALNRLESAAFRLKAA
jgi:small-conductance mechanosensitive channel